MSDFIRTAKCEKCKLWETHCSNCDEMLKNIYVDKEGHKIDQSTRVLLLLNDNIKELIDKVSNLEKELNSFECKVNNLRDDVSASGEENYFLKNDISSLEEEKLLNGK
jgi:septal ring factor EnvC (AmiA/AmiB activator)